MSQSDIFKAFERFQEYMARDGNFTLMILKGHLLIEEQIALLIENRIPRPDILKEADLTSHQQIVLAESLFDERSVDGSDRWLWPAIKKLNKLRNDIAHNLSKSGIEDRIIDFISRIPNKLENGIILDEFEFALWVTCSEVNLRVKPLDPLDY